MRVIKETPDASNFVLLENNTAILASGPNSVSATNTAGVFINGPVSFSSTIDSMKFAGTFRMNPLAASGLPSTMVTPIPMFLIDPPIKGIANMTATASILASLI